MNVPPRIPEMAWKLLWQGLALLGSQYQVLQLRLLFKGQVEMAKDMCHVK